MTGYVPLRVIAGLDSLHQLLGMEVACSDWWLIDQARIQRFADATGDQQWIHTDSVRAARESPHRSTIAHGYLTLSLLPGLMESCLRIDGVGMAINYGLDKVRLPTPVLAGQRIRARLMLERIQQLTVGVQVHWIATIDVENSTKPACVAQMLARYYPAEAFDADHVTNN